MNKKTVTILGLTLLLSHFLFAGGIENKSNLTPGYARNPSRNAESSRPEAAFYNIAGLSFIQDGFYLDLGNQFVIKKYMNDWNGITVPGTPISVKGGETYDNTPVLLYPDIDIVYKRKFFSVFLNFGIYAGGGGLNYDKGTSITSAAFAGGAAKMLGGAKEIAAGITQIQQGIAAQMAGGASQSDVAPLIQQATQLGAQAQGLQTQAQGLLDAANHHKLTVNSITYGWQIGASFRPIDMLSISGALRVVYGTQSMNLKAAGFKQLGNGGDHISYNAYGVALSPVVGVQVRPLDCLDIAVQYQCESFLNYEVSDVGGNKDAGAMFGIKKKGHFRSDIPHALNIGVGYRPIEPLSLSVGFNYYFNEEAAQNSILGKTDYDDSWELSTGADYRIIKQVSVSLGLAYSYQGATKESNSTFNPVLNSLTIGTGVEYTPIKELTITLSGMYVKYFDKDYYISGTYKSTLKKDLGAICIGLTYKAF